MVQCIADVPADHAADMQLSDAHIAPEMTDFAQSGVWNMSTLCFLVCPVAWHWFDLSVTKTCSHVLAQYVHILVSMLPIMTYSAHSLQTFISNCTALGLTLAAGYAEAKLFWVELQALLSTVTGQLGTQFPKIVQHLSSSATGPPQPEYQIGQEAIDIVSLERLNHTHLHKLQLLHSRGVFTDDAWLSLDYTLKRLREDASKPAWLKHLTSSYSTAEHHQASA